MRTLRHAARALARTPAFTVVAVVSLALGFGANTAILSVVRQLLLRPLPVAHAERLVNLSDPGPRGDGDVSCDDAGTCDAVFSRPMIRDIEGAAAPGSAVAAVGAHAGFDANLAGRRRTVRAEGILVSGGYFAALGVAPAAGRLLGPADDRPGAPAVAVVSHAYWTTHLGADPGAVGGPLTVNGRPVTLVGVAQPGFTGTTLERRAAVFVPLAIARQLGAGYDPEGRRGHWIYAFARLAPAATVDQAARALNARYQLAVREAEAPLQAQMDGAERARFLARALVLAPGARGQTRLHADGRTPLLLLAITAAVVLLIACANVAGLLLVRGSARAGELALRHALGATRRRLLALLLAEAVLLAAAGGVVGLLVARVTLRGIVALVPGQLSEVVGASLDARMLGISAALALGTGLAFGLFPAFHGARHAPASTMRGAASQVAGGTRAAGRVRAALVGGQIALAMTLLVTAGLTVRSLVNLAREPLGLVADGVVTFGVTPGRNGYDGRRSAALFAQLERDLAARPGVTGVATAGLGLLRGDESSSSVRAEGYQAARGENLDAYRNRVGPGFFRTLGIPVQAGREFTDADGPGATRVAVVNEAFARRFRLGRAAVGKRIGLGGHAPGSDPLDLVIVGVVRDAKYSRVRGAAPPVAYLPARQDTSATATVFYVRTAGDPAELLQAAPAVVRRLDPDLPVERLTTLPAQARENTAAERLVGTLAGVYAALAAALAALGLYGVLAYAVAQRTREFGVRAALGAAAADLRGLVIGQVGRLVVAGGVLGLAAGLALGRAAQSLLYGVGAQDPVAVSAAMIGLALVALGAGYLPARRAARIDPVRALRAE